MAEARQKTDIDDIDWIPDYIKKVPGYADLIRRRWRPRSRRSSAYGKTLLPAPVLINETVVPSYVRLFQSDPRDFNTADDLCNLTWPELKSVLHMCLIDAAVTADNFAMLFSKMADDERFETLPDDYLDAETASEGELVAA